MKIAYISQIFSMGNMVGVEKKLKDEAYYMSKYGIETIVITFDKDEVCGDIQFVSLRKRLGDISFLGLKSRMNKLRLIGKVLDLDSYDAILLRYPLMDFSSLWYSKKYGYKTITEHHGKELEEIMSYRINFIFKLGQYLFERFLSPLFFKNIVGLVGISDDLVEYEKKRLGFNTKTIRFANGIESSKFKTREIPEITDEFRIVFVASNFSRWHGVDRLLNSLRKYNGNLPVRLYLVGVLDDSYKRLVESVNLKDNVTIELTGKKFGEELDAIFDLCHMACDSLAMHRLNMIESSTLKSKEYIARSIPYLFSSPDKDMNSICNYLYDAGYGENSINITDVINHYHDIDLQKMKNDMHKCLNDVLDWDVKVKLLKEYIEETVQ